jgi:hypothetical protein
MQTTAEGVWVCVCVFWGEYGHVSEGEWTGDKRNIM